MKDSNGPFVEKMKRSWAALRVEHGLGRVPREVREALRGLGTQHPERGLEGELGRAQRAWGLRESGQGRADGHLVPPLPFPGLKAEVVRLSLPLVLRPQAGPCDSEDTRLRGHRSAQEAAHGGELGC